MGLELRALVVGSGFEPLKAKPADLYSARIGLGPKVFHPNRILFKCRVSLSKNCLGILRPSNPGLPTNLSLDQRVNL